MKEYALYRGDEFLKIGTLEELANYLKVERRTILFYASPTYLKRHNGNGYVVVKLD